MMKSLIILPLVLASIVDAIPLEKRPIFGSGRVVGGSDAPDGQYPYQVSVQRFNSHNCGGSIISPEWILTAAHCVDAYTLEDYSVYIGANSLSGNGIRHQVLEIHYHEDYDNELIKNDIAVLKVEPLTYTDRVQPIVLENEVVGGDEPCVLTGWGLDGFPEGSIPDKMQEIELLTTTVEFCKSKHSHPVVESEICTIVDEGRGICTADSGGPLVINVDGTYKQIGVVSWGIPCGRGYPDVYARVSSYMSWIKENCNNCVD